LHGSVRFSNTGIGAGNEEAHNACRVVTITKAG
jgi:hypothetical protein